MSRQLVLAALGLGVLSACALGGDAQDPALETTSAASVTRPRTDNLDAIGRQRFHEAQPGTNGRTCGTCHVEADAWALKPENVVARLNANRNDPLFHRIDADDMNSSIADENLTFKNLKKGLIRVTLKLPDNVDLIAVPPDLTVFSDAVAQAWANSPAANVIVTPQDRMIEVWRSVPTIENTAFSGGAKLVTKNGKLVPEDGGFLFDGRAATLEDQALGALQGHSQASHSIGEGILKQIAQFERTQFSSQRALNVQQQIEALIPAYAPAHLVNDPEAGRWVPDSALVSPEDAMVLTAQQQRGREVYERACTACHGGVRDNELKNPALRPFFKFKADGSGNIEFASPFPGGPSIPQVVPHEMNSFMNIGTAFLTYVGQVGFAPQLFNADIKLPRYRLRFYTDASRTQKVVDLPPVPRSGVNPFAAALDANGHPITGPNLAPQQFTTDPGRALISGDPQDFEGFDIPQLRGIARTAPYFHDNSAPDLFSMVDTYSKFILPFAPPLGLPPEQPTNPPNPAIGGESLTLQQKLDLVSFLEVF